MKQLKKSFKRKVFLRKFNKKKSFEKRKKFKRN